MAGLTDKEVISDEETLKILRVLMLVITPAISVFGIVGNIFSIIILSKHGFQKCSNILLITLAVNDLAFLIGWNNVPKFFYEKIIDNVDGYVYNRDTSFVVFIFHCFFLLLDHASGTVSMNMPVLITIERLIAVFLPLRFHQIVTQKRTWFVVACTQAAWYGICIYVSFWSTFVYEFGPKLNISVGLIHLSQNFHENEKSFIVMQEVIVFLSAKIPPWFSFIGCIIIGVKVKLATMRRKKMTSTSEKDASTSRTTKMLLAVCAVYTAACTIMSLPTYLPQMYYEIFNDNPSNLGKVLYQVINMTLCINSSCNFVVYVVMNKNFRDTYKSLFIGCCGYGIKPEDKSKKR